MTKKSCSLETCIKMAFAPTLRIDGFSGSGRRFWRLVDGLIEIVAVQGSQGGGKFAVNLAIHPAGVPDCLGNPSDPRKMKPELCEFRCRLTDSGSDQWWSHDGSESAMMRALTHAASTYTRVGRQLFAQCSQSSSGIRKISPEQFAKGEFDFHGFASTRIRMARTLALMRDSTGDIESAHGFAVLAMEYGGSSTFFRNELEAISARASRYPSSES